ncbi:MAG: hypothetical protein Q8O19_08205 [Rectinemataceae bacterium]|nr:hypothetical protein [Rectinemataceae bacterium]
MIQKLHLVTYGCCKAFDKSKFHPVKNSTFKPVGGLWASPVISNYGWADWCKEENFRLERLDESFSFYYEGNILTIDTIDDLERLIWVDSCGFKMVDYIQMQSTGIDAIHLTNKGENQTRFTFPRSLYGWDCESVFIMNPEGVTK